MAKINKKDHEIEVLKLYNDELQETNYNLNKEIEMIQIILYKGVLKNV
jgi:hypothetical protein